MPTTLSADHQQLIVSIMAYLQGLGDLDRQIDKDSIEVAIQCVSEATGVQFNNAVASAPLLDVFKAGLATATSNSGKGDGFEKFVKTLAEKGFFEGHAEGTLDYNIRLEKAKHKYNDKYGASQCSPENSAQASKLKLEGNDRLASGNYQGAAETYTKAIELDPKNAILFGNRAVAFTKLEQYDKVVFDCQRSIDLDPNYTKSHYRLGLAFSKLNRVEDAKSSYKNALSTCSDQSSALANEIRSALASLERPANSPSPGGFDMSSLLNNPMVQQMMSDPALMNNMLGAMMGGGAGPNPPPFAAPSQSERPSGDTQSSTGARSRPFDPMSLLSDPNALNEFLDSPRIKAKEQDPELGPLIADLRMNGVGAIMKHIGNPAVMAKLTSLAQDLTSSSPSEQH